MNIKQLVLVLRYSVALLTVLVSVLILIFVSFPLFNVEVNELDKKKVIGMKPSVLMEFDEQKLFWWLTKDGNTLQFENSSDEKIRGKIILELESNPCNYDENVNFIIENQSRTLGIGPNRISIIQIPVEIDHKSSISIFVTFDNKEPCFVRNGDRRNFGAKLVHWNFV